MADRRTTGGRKTKTSQADNPDADASVAGDRGHVGSPPDDREKLVQEGLDHLQRAARETIAAMRTLLDVAEELVEDPRAAETLVTTLGSLASAATRSGPAHALFGRPVPRASGERGDDDEDDGRGVQRIPVS